MEDTVPSLKADSPDSHLPVPKSADISEDLTAKGLAWLSDASSGTLAACVVAIAAVLYTVLGRFGLLLIGVIAGIALHATWERHTGATGHDGEAKRRKEVGLDVARRLLHWQDSRKPGDHYNGAVDAKIEVALKVAARKELTFATYPPATASALTSLTEAIVRDYVKYWYSPVLPGEETFPLAAQQTLTGFILALCNHQARKRPADVLLNFLTNVTSILIVFLSELSHALMVPDAFELEVSEALNLYLDSNPDSNLANIADPEEQNRKFLSAADDILQSFLDPKTYNCETAKLFLRQVLAGVVLQSILTSTAKPEWINGWIVHILEEGEPELITAIDAGVEKAASNAQGSSMTKGLADLHSIQPQAPTTFNIDDKVQAPDYKAREKRASSAGDAMQAAMDEAKRLTDMIRAEEERSIEAVDSTASSAFTTDVQVTPTSSQDGIASTDYSAVPAPANISGGSTMENEDHVGPAQSREQFTSFDQIAPAYRAVPESSKAIPPLTLHNVKITIFDDAPPGDKGLLKSKPQTEYLLQIEPASTLHSGWMVPRKHPELEPLHEYLYKIATVSGAPAFSRKYQYLPSYKGRTKDQYRQDLEKYLHDALSYEPLAESEGMKRFLDKDQGFQKSSAKNPLAFATPVGDAFQSVGKGMLGGLNTATKGVAAGGQAVFGGVGGLFGGQKRGSSSITSVQRNDPSSAGSNRILGLDVSRSSEETDAPLSSLTDEHRHLANHKHSLDTSTNLVAPVAPTAPVVEEMRPALPPRQASSSNPKVPIANDSSIKEALPTPPISVKNSIASLPPNEPVQSLNSDEKSDPILDGPGHADSAHKVSRPRTSSAQSSSHAHQEDSDGDAPQKLFAPIDEQETRVAIELMFAAVNELYTLSSAWNIRRTLLNAAKTYLLRPGNPSLQSIQELLQSNVLDANTSDESFASKFESIRQNSLPTEAELAKWPAPPNYDEKEQLKTKARKLLLSKGMPQALTSVMGTAASAEALGRVFDALQEQRVSRALMFAIMIQGMRTLVQ